MSVRRVATGHDAGRSVVVADTELDPVEVLAAPGMKFYQVWAAASPPTLPFGGNIDVSGPYFPRSGGVRVVHVLLPAQSTAAVDVKIDPTVAAADLEAKLPGLLAHMEPSEPGMHASDTVDVGVVKSGEVWCELDDGKEVHLRAGDFIVQNGTRHRWVNRSQAPSEMTFVVVGATRTSVT